MNARLKKAIERYRESPTMTRLAIVTTNIPPAKEGEDPLATDDYLSVSDAVLDVWHRKSMDADSEKCHIGWLNATYFMEAVREGRKPPKELKSSDDKFRAEPPDFYRSKALGLLEDANDATD